MEDADDMGLAKEHEIPQLQAQLLRDGFPNTSLVLWSIVPV